MADDSALIRQIFTDQARPPRISPQREGGHPEGVQRAGSSSIYNYDPYGGDLPPRRTSVASARRLARPRPCGRTIRTSRRWCRYNVNVPNPSFGNAPTDVPTAPTITCRRSRAASPPTTPATCPACHADVPGAPTFLALPSPRCRTRACRCPLHPCSSRRASMQRAGRHQHHHARRVPAEALRHVHRSTASEHPRLVQNNALTWFRAITNENPNVRAHRQRDHDVPHRWAVPASRCRSRKRSSRAPRTG
jgi:hypothetical protein